MSWNSHTGRLSLASCLFTLVASSLFVGLLGVLPFISHYYLYADKNIGLRDNIRRVGYVQKALHEPQQIKLWSADQIHMVLRDPSLKRSEGPMIAWNYHGNLCAIDIYFREGQSKPRYMEFRPLALNNDVQEHFGDADQETLNLYCLQDVLEAQGVETPNSFARRPLPSWDSPYRS